MKTWTPHSWTVIEAEPQVLTFTLSFSLTLALSVALTFLLSLSTWDLLIHIYVSLGHSELPPEPASHKSCSSEFSDGFWSASCNRGKNQQGPPDGGNVCGAQYK